MSHRRPSGLLLACVLLALALVAGCSTGSGGADDTSDRKPAASGKGNTAPVLPKVKRISKGPNVVLISTDDQALTDMKWMPKTRAALGKKGVTFKNMLSPHPLCCPARAEIVSGQYAQNNGVHSNGGKYGGLKTLKDPTDTIGTWMAEVGYRTAFVGKYLNGYGPKLGYQPGWGYWNASAKSAFGYYGYTMYDNGQVKKYAPNGIYSSDLVTNDTVKLVRNYSKDTSKPFFIWSSYYAPHGLCGDGTGCDAPPEPARRHRNAYPKAKSPSMKKPSFNEKDVSDKPKVIRNRPRLKPSQAQYLFHKRIQSLAAVDEGVSAIVRELRVTGQLDNTLILFTSDNGYLVGEHRYHGKTVGYEESLRVPLIMRGPGIPAGQTRQQTVTTVDLPATIAAAAGAEPKRTIDGRNILPTATSNKRPRGDTQLIQAGPPTWMKNPPPWWYRGVRTDRYTYIRWTGKKPFVELYDRKYDPYQLTNVSTMGRYGKVRAELAKRTKAVTGCSGAAECSPTFGPVPKVPGRR